MFGLSIAGAGRKKLTEIPPFFVDYALGNRLPALVVISGVVVVAVEAGVEGPIAGWASSPKLDPFARIDLLTAIPALHIVALLPLKIP